MKNKLKTIIIVFGIVILIGAIVFSITFFLNKSNKLTVAERKWIDSNINVIQNVNVVNDANVFGSNGSGVFYDFLDDFTSDYKIKFNPITFSLGTAKTGITFTSKNEVNDNDLIFYEDHYVLVSKNTQIINNNDDLRGKTIGLSSDNLTYISKYLNTTNLTFKQYNSKVELISSLDSETDFIMVPLLNYIDTILKNNYEIVYHFSDINNYYVLETTDDYLSSSLKKYYSTWENNKNDYFNEHEFNTFVTSLNISDSEIDAIQSGIYQYGFVNTSPYEVIQGGNYGGIIAVLLKDFSDFSSVEFNFVKYNNYKAFVKAIDDGKIDLYFNHYNLNNNYYETTSGFINNYVIVANQKNNVSLKSTNSLIGKTVYVEQNSKLYDYLIKIEGINVKTYADSKALFKLNKTDSIIMLDKYTFAYYSKNKLDNYTIRYEDNLNDSSKMKVSTNSALYTLLSKYMMTLDKDIVINEGINNHLETMKTGNVLGTLAEYIIYLVIISVVVIFFLVRKTKKISIARKIKKDDKMKFIDQLTSLKNRNYLNECFEGWNKNTIYPQTIIVLNLNKVQTLNDKYGYNEGDRQIKAMANALIKTQLDNSEIMRTDGNEFVIYLIGYSQKQVINYIHKLEKEIEKLPYNNGAKFGYSMIEDDLKTLEDALNEAESDMVKQKNEEKN